MRIGIVPELGGGGGIYQYSLAVLNALSDWTTRHVTDEVVLFTDETGHPALRSPNGHHWTIRPLTPPPEQPSAAERGSNVVKRLLGEGPHRELLRRVRRKVFPAWWSSISG